MVCSTSRLLWARILGRSMGEMGDSSEVVMEVLEIVMEVLEVVI